MLLTKFDQQFSKLLIGTWTFILLYIIYLYSLYFDHKDEINKNNTSHVSAQLCPTKRTRGRENTGSRGKSDNGYVENGGNDECYWSHVSPAEWKLCRTLFFLAELAKLWDLGTTVSIKCDFTDKLFKNVFQKAAKIMCSFEFICWNHITLIRTLHFDLLPWIYHRHLSIASRCA